MDWFLYNGNIRLKLLKTVIITATINQNQHIFRMYRSSQHDVFCKGILKNFSKFP